MDPILRFSFNRTDLIQDLVTFLHGKSLPLVYNLY
ncbi:Uncharacterised protein (plasmid) [Legionella adelaidensis]|uniref:Uncharacterized protein n=1 Tax=Legionella adelaidensis TaxID=45056 RepID=A0A3S4UMN3_9GAMM|nr:Uncharacterised protein [Legionella adelaidensis]